MANTLLTPDMITKDALMILHQKLNFVGNINRQYEASFAQSGAKIGDSLRIRLPNEYTVRTGAAISTQDTTEQSTTLQVATQKGVDTTFTSAELTLDIELKTREQTLLSGVPDHQVLVELAARLSFAPDDELTRFSVSVPKLLDDRGALPWREAARSPCVFPGAGHHENAAIDALDGRHDIGRLRASEREGLADWRVRNASGDCIFVCELGPPEYAMTGPDGREMSNRWHEAQVIKGWVQDIWDDLGGDG